MYIPEFNRIEDRATAIAFMRANPFAVLVSTAENGPFATHLPLLIDGSESQISICGHFAKANPHWQMIEKQESLIIFHGAHAYISPSLYEVRESVPTWNYAAVHVYGKGRVLSDEHDARGVLEGLIARFDNSYRAQWDSFTDDYRTRMLRHIVAFEIASTRIETKFKLSQNRTKAEQENVIRALSGNPDSAVIEMATLMRRQGLGTRSKQGA